MKIKIMAVLAVVMITAGWACAQTAYRSDLEIQEVRNPIALQDILNYNFGTLTQTLTSAQYIAATGVVQTAKMAAIAQASANATNAANAAAAGVAVAGTNYAGVVAGIAATNISGYVSGTFTNVSSITGALWNVEEVLVNGLRKSRTAITAR